MKKTNSSVNNVAVRRLVSRTSLGVRQKNLARASAKSRQVSKTYKSTAKSPAIKQTKRPSQLIKNTFLPNHTNNYRPHLVRRAGLVLMAAFLIMLNLSYFYVQNQKVLGARTDVNTETLLAATNAARAKDNLSPLTANVELTAAAQSKAEDMLANGYWSHNSPTGKTPWYFIKNSGYSYSYAGENLARGFTSGDAVLQAWLASPSHRANVLDKDYTEVGMAVKTGYMNGQATTLVVAMYGRPTGAASMPAPNSGGTSSVNTKIGTTENGESFWSLLARGIVDLTPSLIFTLAVLTIAAVVVIVAYLAHWKLSPRMKRTWRLHGALIKLSFIAFLMIGAILSYGGGVI